MAADDENDGQEQLRKKLQELRAKRSVMLARFSRGMQDLLKKSVEFLPNWPADIPLESADGELPTQGLFDFIDRHGLAKATEYFDAAAVQSFTETCVLVLYHFHRANQFYEAGELLAIEMGFNDPE